jgi:hexosaminidase
MRNVLPTAKKLQLDPGVRVWPKTVRLDGPDEDRVKRAAGRMLGIDVVGMESGFTITWSAAADLTTAAESYRLRITDESIHLQAESIKGALHGITTLAQLRNGTTIPCCEITDAPRYPWRGLMLDPARHFLPIDLIESVVEGLAALKMNVLHLHLSDDQGFRFESKAHAGLASPDHYTQAELKSLVEFAADRGVRIVPEFDVPGHVTSWLVAYPAWGNRPTRTTTRFGVHPGCLNPTDEGVYTALEALFDEVCAVFPDPCIHIGGDEVHSSWWKEDPAVQSFMRANDLADSAALQAHFTGRIVAMLKARGRTAIGWDEVLHPALPEGVIVQSWRGATARDRCLHAGHDCIVSSGFYLDLFYPGSVHRAYQPDAHEAELLRQEDHLLGDDRFAHVAEGMKWTHVWRSVPSAGKGREPGKVLGGEACLWGELVDANTLDGRLWSRLPDIAECFWAEHPEEDDEALRSRWPGIVREHINLNWRKLAALAVDELILEGFELCEPVKWYARLLGDVALNARIQGREMPQARPYGTETSLDRVVDFLLPESLLCRDVRTWPIGQVATACARWGGLSGRNDVPQDVQAVFTAIGEASRTWLDCLSGDLSREEAARILQGLHRPCGEYMPAIILILLERL